MLEISRWKALELATEFDGNDPFPDIECALLSKDHIIKYANKTGMIAPLYFRGENKRRMKKALYEGRIGGDYAYKYDDNDAPKEIPVKDGLVVEANSIVFVECDIDFNLPNFIAVRFNLQIRHVHRGLLLGTGPLVDPGYKGRLCIPIHNLTDKDYLIPVDKGLIWMEFTKTSGKADEGMPPRGLSTREFILQAAGQYGTSHVPIRSSMRGVIRRSERSARELRILRRITNGGGLAVAIALVAIGYAAYDNIQSAYNSVGPQASEAHTQSALNEKDIGLNEEDIQILQLKVEEMKEEIQDLRNRIVDAQNQNDAP